MNELIERLTKEAGITPEQATKAVDAIAAFVKEKFPMLGGAVDNIFKSGSED
jgi:nucleoid DNA-binding protein